MSMIGYINRRYAFVHDVNIDKLDFDMLSNTSKDTTRRVGLYYLIQWDPSSVSKKFYKKYKKYFRLFGEQFEFTHKEILSIINDPFLEKQLDREAKLDNLLDN